MKKHSARTLGLTRGLAFHAFAFVGVCLLAGCGTYSDVRERTPRFLPQAVGQGEGTGVETQIAKALREERSQPENALSNYLSAAQTTEKQLQRDPENAAAIRNYNFAVGRIIEIIGDAKLAPWPKPIVVTGDAGVFKLAVKPDPRPQWNPALYDFTPADQFDIRGQYVTERITRAGIGAPIVATGRGMNEDAKRDFTIPKIFYGVTAVVRFKGQRAVIAFEDPLAAERVNLGRRNVPMAADFTVPLAVMLASENPKKLELTRLLRPEKYAETARIARLQPYDPNKAVVLVIHGLMDSPATWVPMINKLRSDEQIRRNYQFWFYSYPSGYPYPHSAAILRRELDAVQKRFPLRKKMILIGHSMGGCISRLLITDTGDKLWRAYFQHPPEETRLSPATRKLFTDALIFRPRQEVGRVIFVSSPLKGSELAGNWLGRIASSLVRSPITLLKAGEDALKIATTEPGALKMNRMPNSVDTLAPDNRFVKAINTIPITPGVPYHTIIGDRGKGDSPNSSDGVVPYWSSHMDGAKSELIVPSAHNAHQNPQAIAEVLRLLKTHAPQ